MKNNNLEKLVNLKKFCCRHNQLESLNGLKNCSSLHELDCSFNNIKYLDINLNNIDIIYEQCLAIPEFKLEMDKLNIIFNDIS